MYEGMFFLLPPLAIQWATDYISWLYNQRDAHAPVDVNAMLGSTFMFILIFTALPVLGGVASSVSKLVLARISTNLAGALSLAVYDKALRLPLAKNEANGDQPSTSDAASPDEDKKSSVGRAEAASKAEVVENDAKSEDRNEFEGTTFNLVQLVMNDIAVNVTSFQYVTIKAFVIWPVCGVMFIILAAKLYWSALVALACVFSLDLASLHLAWPWEVLWRSITDSRACD